MVDPLLQFSDFEQEEWQIQQQNKAIRRLQDRISQLEAQVVALTQVLHEQVLLVQPGAPMETIRS